MSCSSLLDIVILCFADCPPTLKSLHWLPVKQCIIFETLDLLLIHYYLTIGKPEYFAPYLSLYISAVKTRHSNPEKMFLKVSFYNSSIHKSIVHFFKCFSYDAPKLIFFRSLFPLFSISFSYYRTPLVHWCRPYYVLRLMIYAL